MKIREVRIQNFRSFGPALRTISFVNEATDRARPLSVLVGSNGSGKTTILRTIEGLLHFAVDGDEAGEFCNDLREAGFADLTMELGPQSPDDISKTLRIALGRKDRTTVDYRSTYTYSDICALVQRGTSGNPFLRDIPRSKLHRWVHHMLQGREPLVDGLLYFPHLRWIEHEQRGAIGEPAQSRQWLFRFEPSTAWEGSLSQLWVWQNYLDLEQSREGRPNLTPFVAAIETILGPGRNVVIRQGRVTVEHPTLGRLELHHLPSGEQQVLTLFGEIIRRLRPGAVVMIDEVELSLHPALQRAVLFHLRELARAYDLQLLLTTHSMEIVSAVAPDELINLDEMVLTERAHAQGAAT